MGTKGKRLPLPLQGRGPGGEVKMDMLMWAEPAREAPDTARP